ncbi:hypothetical protein [Oscillibacter ruminantium]|uniref:hypothetical protein n=1 Tax=Oscillibacter ruminantium TaxID=1263547 RepID=UPI00031C97D0|nr:hypothetical protein [Oscillibacter ruminantium]
MKLFSEIKRIFQCDEISISERMNTVEASFTTSVRCFPETILIQSVCALVPSRDIMTLSFRNDSGDIIPITSRQKDLPDLSLLLDGLEADDSIEVKIQIDKTVSSNKFSIFHFETFSNDLLGHSLVDILSWFSSLLTSQEFLVFEVFDFDIMFSTGTLAFVSNEKSEFRSKLNRIQRLRICKETAYFYNMNSYEIIPEDFAIDGIEQNAGCFKELFGKLATILSLIYTASSASIIDTSLAIQISGQRTMSYSLQLDGIDENFEWLQIYTWIFTDGNPTDKALIAHNVISLHCKYANLLDIDEKVFDSIKTNYNLYLRNNVDRYLDLKRDISKFIRDVVAQVGDYAVAILNKFKANLIAIFGFLFTVVLTKVGATQKWDNIFSRDTIYILELVIIGSIVYLGICFYEAHLKLTKTKQAYTALKKNYSDILSEAEIKEAFGEDKLLVDTEKFARKRMIIWSVIWGVLLIVTIAVIELLTENRGVFAWLLQKLLQKTS